MATRNEEKRLARAGYRKGHGAAGEEWEKDVEGGSQLVTEAEDGGWMIGAYADDGSQIMVLYFDTLEKLLESRAV